MPMLSEEEARQREEVSNRYLEEERGRHTVTERRLAEVEEAAQEVVLAYKEFEESPTTAGLDQSHDHAIFKLRRRMAGLERVVVKPTIKPTPR